MPCEPARARQLLRKGRARVAHRAPFTIRLVDRKAGVVQPIELKIDPGSKTTGMALVRKEQSDDQTTIHALHLAELSHRGERVRDLLTVRRAFRRARRSRKLRYRKPRFQNRARSKGWLAPSLRCRVDNVTSWADRYRRLCPITTLVVEQNRFDPQAIQCPGIEGAQYQQGTLAGYEIREYVLEKWGRRCVYCDAADIPLQLDHLLAKRRGGTNRVGNLAPACERCNNQLKGSMAVEEFLKDDPKRLARILAKADKPLSHLAAVNATRFAVVDRLRKTGLSVECSTGGRTKYNRSRLGIPKSHCLDALATGTFDDAQGWRMAYLPISAMGRGSRKRTRLTEYGFPRGYLMRRKQVYGFQTGDLVEAVVPNGTKAGRYTGRVAVRASGSFNIQTPQGTVQGIGRRRCRVLQRADGYRHSKPGLPPGPEGPGFRPGETEVEIRPEVV